MVANIYGADAAIVSWERWENLEAFPPFPTWEGVLASETGDPGMTVGWEFCGEAVDGVTKPITFVCKIATSDLE